MRNKDDRKGKIITIGEDVRLRIPQLFTDVYKIQQTAATDGEDLEEDETFRVHTLRTVYVEGTNIVDGGKAVNVNGDFDISLEKVDLDDETPKELRQKVWANKDEAIEVWEKLTELELARAKRLKDKIDATVITLQTSKDERQF